jgi:hypothetical protein
MTSEEVAQALSDALKHSDEENANKVKDAQVNSKLDDDHSGE